MKYQSPQLVRVALIFSKYRGGAGWPIGPLLHDPPPIKKLLSYNPLYIGENSCITYPQHRGFHDKTCENSRKYQHQSARNGIRVHHLHPFFQNQKKKNQGRPPPPSFARGENYLYIYFKRWKYSRITYILGVVGKLEKILTSNRQKWLIRHHLHSFFKTFLGETLTPPQLTIFFIGTAGVGGGAGAPSAPPPPLLKSATGTPPLNFWHFDDVLCTSCCPSFNLAPFL